MQNCIKIVYNSIRWNSLERTNHYTDLLIAGLLSFVKFVCISLSLFVCRLHLLAKDIAIDEKVDKNTHLFSHSFSIRFVYAHIS